MNVVGVDVIGAEDVQFGALEDDTVVVDCK